MSEDTVSDHCIREHGTIYVGEMVTCSVIISEFATLIFGIIIIIIIIIIIFVIVIIIVIIITITIIIIIGTKAGTVLASNDMSDESLIEVEGIRYHHHYLHNNNNNNHNHNHN